MLSVEEDFRLLLQLALLTLLLMIFLYPLDAGRFNSGFSFESPSLWALLAAFQPQAPASHAIGLSRLRCAVVKVRHPCKRMMVGRSGLEPPTSRLSGECSNQLS